jgi:hypothetical protein
VDASELALRVLGSGNDTVRVQQWRHGRRSRGFRRRNEHDVQLGHRGVDVQLRCDRVDVELRWNRVDVQLGHVRIEFQLGARCKQFGTWHEFEHEFGVGLELGRTQRRGDRFEFRFELGIGLGVEFGSTP